ncbi:MAG: hypothetical protein WB952_06050 [Terriglobales bacterium]
MSVQQAEWPWPDSLDALVAAPNHHTLLLENHRVRVLDVHIPPGDTVPVHTHRWPSAVYILSGSDFIRRDDSRNITFDSRTAPASPITQAAVWQAPLPPHSVENVGNSEIRLISVELKTEL